MTTAATSYIERECKLDAPDDAVIAHVRAYILSSPRIFTPSTRLEHVGIPSAMRGSFAAPMEVTEPRIRLYWDDIDLTAQKNGIEIRQEPRPKGGIKQMVKIGGAKGAVLDRAEHSANLDHFGLNFDAVKDVPLRNRLKKLLASKNLKPIICMVSQRTRINYHPDGDKNVLIELGLDAPCRGHVFDGHSWNNPQIELELLQGDDVSVLEEEAGRLERLFDLTPNTSSKPAAGFVHLKGLLASPLGRKAFAAHDSKVIWWTR